MANTAEWRLRITEAGASRAAAAVGALGAGARAATSAYEKLRRTVERPMATQGVAAPRGPRSTRALGTMFSAPATGSFRAPRPTLSQRGGPGGSVSASSAGADAAAESAFGSIGGKAAVMGGPLGMAIAAASHGQALAKSAATLAAKGGAWVVQTAEARQNMSTSFEVMLRSEQKAAELMAGIQKFARDTPFTTDQVANVMKSLVGAGYDAKTAFDIFKRIGDASAFAGFDERALDGVTRAITQIKAKGKLSAEELNQIFEAAPGAVSRETLIDTLAKNLGKSREAIQSELETGKIKADDGIKAILGTIDSTISGGKAGGLMDKLGSSITGRLSSLVDLPSMLIGMTKNMPGLEAFRETLGNMMAGFDEAFEPLKAATQGLINDVFGALFGALGSADGKDTFKNVFLGIAKAIEYVRSTARSLVPYVRDAFVIFGAFWDGFKQAFVVVAPALSAIWDGLKKAFGGETKSTTELLAAIFNKIGVTLGWVALIVGALGAAFIAAGQVFLAITTTIAGAFAYLSTVLVGTFISLLGDLPARAVQIGVQIVTGLVNGIRSMLGLATTASAELGAAATSGATTELKVQSPSKVFKGIGGHVADGLAIGMAGGAKGVAGAAGDMAGASVGGATAGLLPGGTGAGAGSGGAPTIVIQVDASGLGDREAGEAVGDKLVDGGLVDQLRAALEQALGQFGAPGFGPLGAGA